MAVVACCEKRGQNYSLKEKNDLRTTKGTIKFKFKKM